MTDSLVSDLAAVIGPESVADDADVVQAYSRDRAMFDVAGTARVVVMPRTTDEVREVINVARRYGVAVVTRGAGSGLAGGANAADGCIVLSLHRMNKILEVDRVNRLARVQPGVLNGQLKAAAAQQGLWYPPDPASVEFCSIGGNIATNAGGLCCVRYGVTRDYVMGLEVVLASGEVVRTGRTTQKKTTGLDLTGLFVGSEGILGVVTEATLKLIPPQPVAGTAVAYFDDLESAGAAIVEVFAVGLQPSLMEIIDQLCLQRVDDAYNMGLDTTAACLLLFQSVEGNESIEQIARICRSNAATDTMFVNDPDEGEMFLEVRRRVWPAFEKLGKSMLPEDVAVPRERLPQLLAGIGEIGRRVGIDIPTVGHAGDGNLHPILVFDPSELAEQESAELAFVEIVDLALALGGTAAGEHGIGTLKRRFVEQEIPTADLALQRRLKAMLDPDSLLNPDRAI